MPIQEGLKNRAIGSHNMNEHSSRSHTILTVHIHSEEKASSDDNKVYSKCRHMMGSRVEKKRPCREYWIIYRGPQPFLPSYDSAPPPPLPCKLSRQKVVSLPQSSCVSPVELTDGRGGVGERACLVLYKSFNTLCVFVCRARLPNSGGKCQVIFYKEKYLQ